MIRFAFELVKRDGELFEFKVTARPFQGEESAPFVALLDEHGLGIYPGPGQTTLPYSGLIDNPLHDTLKAYVAGAMGKPHYTWAREPGDE